MKRGILCALLISIMAGVSQGTVVFYTDKAAFDADTTTTTIGFEGQGVGDTEIGPLVASITINDVVFGDVVFTSGAGHKVAISGGNSGLSGAPFHSALLFANTMAEPILATLPVGITAVGGFFGDIDGSNGGGSPEGTVMTLTLASGGAQAGQTLVTVDMGSNSTPNFFGWTVDNDTILSINHGFTGSFAGLDNFQYGYLNVDPGGAIPEPASCVVWSLIGLSCLGAGCWRRRKAA